MSETNANRQLPFILRQEMPPMTRRDWQLFVSAHALALVKAFPDDGWKKYLRTHLDGNKEQLSEQELTLRYQKDVIGLCGASGLLSSIVGNSADEISFREVRQLVRQDINSLFQKDPLQAVRMPRNPNDFSE